MLAYVFWHAPEVDFDRVEYERLLGAFHEALATNRPFGFVASKVYRAEGVEWVDAGIAYEDWYLLESSAALDSLNEGAVAEPCRQAHDAVARRAASGTAGLYRLLRGIPHGGEKRFAIWLAKPRSLTYDDFLARLAPIGGTTLWQRQMVLGPAREFCLAGFESRPEPDALLDEGNAIVVERTLVWEASP